MDELVAVKKSWTEWTNQSTATVKKSLMPNLSQKGWLLQYQIFKERLILNISQENSFSMLNV